MRKATDLDRLQGEWRITALELDGQAAPDEMLAGGSIVVKGNRFTSTGMGAVYEGEIALDASATPCRLDMKFDAGPEAGNSNPGIYEIDGDTWRLCLATRGVERPTGFASRPGGGFALETLTRATATAAPQKSRKAAAPATPAGASRPTPFEGEWQMLSGIMNGQPMEESAVKWVKRITRGNLTTVKAGPQVMLAFEFTADAGPSPHWIDYRNTAGQYKGKTQQGIYELKGDVLRVCVAAPGDPRPREFRSTKGDQRTLTAWNRVL